jgi:hypothetical protein
MDMKRILQAMDGVATKPVAGVNDMARFLRVVSDKPAEVINESANPHKVTLPVQMAMQHFQSPTATTENTSHIKTSIRKFFREVEEQTTEEIALEQDQKHQLIKQYSQSIAERVLMKENRSTPQTAPTVQQDDNPKNSSLNYTGDNVNVIRFLDKAKAGAGSGAKNDFEAAVTAAATMADTAQRQQHTIEQQQERERKLQHTLSRLQKVLDDTNDRFAELTTKVASGEISDQEAALASQQIDKDSKAQRAEIERTKDHDHKDHEEKTVTAKSEPTTVAKASEKSAVKKAVVPRPKVEPVTTTVPDKVAPAKQVRQVNPFQAAMYPAKVAKRLAKSTANYATTTHLGARDARGNLITPQPVVPSTTDLAQEKPAQADNTNVVQFPTRDQLAYSNGVLAAAGLKESVTFQNDEYDLQTQATGGMKKQVGEDAMSAGVKIGATIFGDLVKAYREFHPNLTINFGKDRVILPRDKIEQLLVRYGQLDQAGREKFINTILTNKQRLLGFIELTQHLPKPRINYKRVPNNPVKTVKQAPTADKAQLNLPLPPPEPEQGTLFELSKFTLSEHTVPGHSMGFKPGAGFSGTQPVDETPIAMDPAEPNNPLVHGHQQANPATLRDRIVRARAQLKELSQMAESDDLLAWERITQLAKGGMFMGLEQNLEQIRHAINELVKKRKAGGIQSRGINKNIG